jgi:hypothetical protein
MTQTRRVRRRLRAAGLGRRREELDQLEPSVAVAARLEPERDEELDRGREVVDHDADVVHPLDRHVFDAKQATSAARLGP